MSERIFETNLVFSLLVRNAVTFYSSASTPALKIQLQINMLQCPQYVDLKILVWLSFRLRFYRSRIIALLLFFADNVSYLVLFRDTVFQEHTFFS